MPALSDQQFSPNFQKMLDIESLISAPLVAVSKANVVMAQGQTRFLLEYCFNKNGESYEPVLIQMALTKTVIEPIYDPETKTTTHTIKNVTSTFNLPLLTIVPFNSLAVDKVNIDFDLEITSASSKPMSTANDSGNAITDKKPKLYGKVAYDSSQNNNSLNKSSLSSKIKVNLNAGSLPLPSGMLTIIDLYTKSITALPITENKPLTP